MCNYFDIVKLNPFLNNKYQLIDYFKTNIVKI